MDKIDRSYWKTMKEENAWWLSFFAAFIEVRLFWRLKRELVAPG